MGKSTNILVITSLLAGLFAISAPSRASAQEIFENGPELLGRPTAGSVTISSIANVPLWAYFEYRTATGVSNSTPPQEFVADSFGFGDVPIEVILDGLQPNTQYFYRMYYCVVGVGDCGAATTTWTEREEHSFWTQRAAGSTFTFAITSDSHVGWGSFMNEARYVQTMTNLNASDPDFQIDLGDAFTMDSAYVYPPVPVDAAKARDVYLKQRPFFGYASHSAPLFLALGNHENEEGWNRDDKANPADSLPIIGTNARKRYYLNPVPDDFYSGNEDADCRVTGVSEANTVPCSYIDGDHLREDYFAWQWGDALFVVIDPYWYSMTKPYTGGLGGEETDDDVSNPTPWYWTLGTDQYQWLKQTLTESQAKYKLVFAHQLTGGGLSNTDYGYGRGGADATPYFEWGGHNPDGSWGWDDLRPDWQAEVPVHQLFINTGVTAFFHGHDHVFATEKMHGIVYQECPRADDPTDNSTGFGYYDPSEMKGNSGFVRVEVSPDEVQVQYIKTHIAGDLGENDNGQPIYEYTIEPDSIGPAPSAGVQIVTTQEDVPLDITPAVEDADDYLFTFTVLSGPTNGTAIARTGNRITYTPKGNWNGTDSFTYRVEDHDGQTATGSVSVNVTPVDDGPPSPAHDSASVDEDGSGLVEVLLNDEIADGPATVIVPTQPAHGEATVNSDNVITYSPAADWNGQETFAYLVTDVDGDTATATITVAVDPVDDTVIAVNDKVSVAEDQSAIVGVLDNDSVADVPAAVTLTVGPANGTALANANGTVTYTPNTNWNGEDSFSYEVTDVDGDISAATVAVAVKPVDDGPPDAVADSASTEKDVLVVIDVLSNDTAVDAPVTVAVLIQPTGGTAVVAGDNTITYTPSAGWAGDDSFTYMIEDLDGQTDTTEVLVAVGTTDDGAPVVVDDSSDTDESAESENGSGSGCGCSTGNPAELASLSLLALALLRRRRRIG